MLELADDLILVQATSQAMERLQWYGALPSLTWIVSPSGNLEPLSRPADQPPTLDAKALCGLAELHEGVGWVWARVRDDFASFHGPMEALAVSSMMFGEAATCIVPFVRQEEKITFGYAYYYDLSETTPAVESQVGLCPFRFARPTNPGIS
jgi:hypothetical protein